MLGLAAKPDATAAAKHWPPKEARRHYAQQCSGNPFTKLRLQSCVRRQRLLLFLRGVAPRERNIMQRKIFALHRRK
jgi:hypothetical protein